MDTVMTPAERAAQLGTEHGRAAGEAWLARWVRSPWVHAMPSEESALPVPDLSADELQDTLADLDDDSPEVDGWPNLSPMLDAYSAAFTAAVEETVREAVR